MDAHTVEQNDLSFADALSHLGSVTVFPRTEKKEVIARIGDAEAVYTNKVVIGAEIFDNCPNLKFVGINATGFNVVDIAEAKKHGVTVCNVPSYSTNSVAQLTFALLLELCDGVAKHDAAVKNGQWAYAKDFCFTVLPVGELAGKTFGIVGYGNIGRAVEKIAVAFGMKTLIFNRTQRDGTVPLDEVLKNSDVVSLRCALSADNAKMIDENALKLMKPSAFLINTARGGLIDENALAEALNQGRIAGAALDVLTAEPPDSKNPLLCAKNCIITPHIAWMSAEARKRLLEITVRNLEAFMEGKPQNVVC